MKGKIIDTHNLNEARKLIEKLANEKKEIIVKGKTIGFNRIILENKKVNMLILNHKTGKDKLKQRDSGLNQVLCKIAKKNNIVLAIDLNELKEEKEKKEKAKILARIIQNIKLIKKYKNELKLLNFKNKSQAFSFLITLGLPTDQAKKAVS